MTFDEQYPDTLVGFQPPPRWDDDGVIRVQESRACWNCGTLTAFVDLSFETHMCSEECRDVKWDEYFAALLKNKPSPG